jgi:hypothetical protein
MSIRENDITVSDLQYSFSTDFKYMDKIITIDLIDNGRNIDVTESNKQNFIK